MALRIPWNKHEAVLLLDACVRIQAGAVERADEIKELSKKLRKMAVLGNIEIDNIYRNENGISWQMSVMEIALNGENGKALSGHSGLFDRVVNLYKTTPEKFELFLAEAKDRVNESVDKDIFENEPACQIRNSEELRILLRKVFKQNFPNGIRDNSQIELNKLKRFMNEEAPEEIDDTLLEEIKTIGFLSHGRIYVIDEIDEEQIGALIWDYAQLGHKIIYFEDFYSVNKEFLNGCNIYAPEVLKSWIKNRFGDFSYDSYFFSMKKGFKLEDEIKKVFKQGEILMPEEVKRRLPYMSIHTIKRLLGVSKCFVGDNAGAYMLLDDIFIDANAFSVVLSEVDQSIVENGYASFSKLDLSLIYSDNPYLSQTVVRNAVGRKVGEKYRVQGNLITRADCFMNMSDILKTFCISRQHLTEQELFDLEAEIAGGQSRRCLGIASENMIRINKNEYVAMGAVKFDIDCIDESIKRFVGHNIIGMREIDSFVSFPALEGYEWNVFLLESFCRHYSRQFSFQSMCANSKCVGAIYNAKEHYEKYSDLLANVLAANGIRDEYTANEYLIEKGFIARRMNVNNILGKGQFI